MSGRVGRNPFEKSRKVTPVEEKLIGEMIDLHEDDDAPLDTPKGLFTRVFVDMPAQAYVFSLKARMIARTILK